ncbi:class I poly(R)-hydroxyalkanoic acid synthase [Sphingomonas sp. ABOLD]|uniref:Polyhydroxyalkanoate synthase n=1 Tax=Sphingomonas trueperi TaxID=53317 RepID=A0A7X5XVD9_9SPHN|nr:MULTISPECIES: class I poly(R)-hydroxyalkanoic acid synthase [Sphingomonas]NJB95772.1 polyhydroxyalkanoate synthase [Sphingomonas trueperi]RSV39424.1 class I poly(R)-hydroxyalkanoic acid synthase [Sphingomonas sp. ABOLE]RSV49192.1 class I poly(R)-hydroxyalkanoic acid synthase [Sphingomonas sp. ABOLD]
MPDTLTPTLPRLEDLQHWTWVLGRAQQMMLEHGLDLMEHVPAAPPFGMLLDPTPAMRASADFWADTMQLWQRFLDPANAEPFVESPEQARDRRFKAPQWREEPIFDFLRQSYFVIADHLLKNVEALEHVDGRQKDQIRFATQGFIDAISPTNFPATNPQVIEKIVETKGESLLKGLQHMLQDMAKGQMTQTAAGAFELGRNLAMTPGKVIKRTPLYELIQYSPTTDEVLETPLIIFPPWINRFYILDLTPEKSFIRWAVEQGITVFVVSWRSADASMKDVVWDDYVERGQIDAIDTVRDLLGVESVHTIGYCVAGTTLAATLAVLAARDQAAKVASATFFTAQVDFTEAGDLRVFIDDDQLAMIRSLSADGFLDGRYMAATFNLLRGRDLIWNYVTNNYLMGQEYAPFDLLHWNSDVTNLPASWHLSYLTDLYRDNKLIAPGALRIGGTPVDLSKVTTPSYIQAGREDHIAPAKSVWKLTEYFRGPHKFVLAGSGHIAGVINPPSAKKYQYWTNQGPAESLESFLEKATEHAGSWWPDWLDWLRAVSGAKVAANGARVPGGGNLCAVAEAPGDYVKMR